MTFIEEVQQTSQSVNGGKEKVLAWVKTEIKEASKYGYTVRSFPTFSMAGTISSAVPEYGSYGNNVNRFFEVMNYVIKELTEQGFKVGYNTNECGFHGFYVEW